MRDRRDQRDLGGVEILITLVVLTIILFCIGVVLRYVGLPWLVSGLIVGVLAALSTKSLFD